MSDPLIKKRKIKVDGMIGRASEEKIKDYLKGKNGVISAEVESQGGKVRVEYEKNKF